ncbi:unnamed protein product [Enterobius vermicularis]|uniref:Uncharacterized protein n=1 Tax=Enterobius vermicularis TaxID=51028 RepID=A0A0N4VIU1_ENTVE|nr:unnamed protein product [Enterobius vermicularis]
MSAAIVVGGGGDSDDDDVDDDKICDDVGGGYDGNGDNVGFGSIERLVLGKWNGERGERGREELPSKSIHFFQFIF